MTHAEITRKFFKLTDEATRERVIAKIATHYGISTRDALAEITHDEAESLLDYLTGPERAATRVLMARHGLV